MQAMILTSRSKIKPISVKKSSTQLLTCSLKCTGGWAIDLTLARQRSSIKLPLLNNTAFSQ